MTDTFAHCFFPVFTQRLMRELGDGRSINLVGTQDNGASRVLEDLCRIPPEAVTLVRVNMHDMRQSYAAFVDALWQRVKAARIVRNNSAPPSDIGGWCDALKESACVWLILERFDTLLEDPERDPRFHCVFFRDELNHLRNRPNLILLTQTARPHREYVVLCKPNEPSLSPPDLQGEKLPALNEADIRAELKRRLSDLEPSSVVLVADAVRGRANGFQFLEVCIRKLEQGADIELPLPKRLHRWRREAEDILPQLNLGNLGRLRRWLKHRLRVLGYSLLDLFKEASTLRKVADLVRSGWKQWRGH